MHIKTRCSGARSSVKVVGQTRRRNKKTFTKVSSCYYIALHALPIYILTHDHPNRVLLIDMQRKGRISMILRFILRNK